MVQKLIQHPFSWALPSFKTYQNFIAPSHMKPIKKHNEDNIFLTINKPNLTFLPEAFQPLHCLLYSTLP